MIKIGMIGPSAPWFNKLFNLTVLEEQKFNEICQMINETIVLNIARLIHEKQLKKDQNTKVAYHIQFCKNIWSPIKQEILKLPGEMKNTLGFLFWFKKCQEKYFYN